MAGSCNCHATCQKAPDRNYLEGRYKVFPSVSLISNLGPHWSHMDAKNGIKRGKAPKLASTGVELTAACVTVSL